MISCKNIERDIEDPYAFFYQDSYYMIVEDRMDIASSLAGKPTENPKKGGNRPDEADIDRSGAVNFWDIRPFIGLLSGS